MTPLVGPLQMAPVIVDGDRAEKTTENRLTYPV